MAKQRSSLLDEEKTTEAVLKIIASSALPVSVDWISKNAKLNWSTARALLFQLALDGKITATRTTKGWIFRIPVEKAGE